jgi:hypothetical protein
LHQKVGFGKGVTLGELYLGNGQVVKALCSATNGAFKVDVVVFVLMMVAVVAQRIAGAAIINGYLVQQALLHKRGKRAVYGNPIKLLPYFALNIAMRQGMWLHHKGI